MPNYTGIYEDPGVYKITEPGAYHMIGNDDYEPQRSNNFELRIYFKNGDKLTTVDRNLEIGTDVAEKTLIFDLQSVSGIETDVNVLEIPYGNTKVKYAGLPSISGLEVVYNDYIGKSTERVLAAWHKLVFDPKSQFIGRASKYKKDGILIETAPDGTHARVWQLEGIWPSKISYGGYDYSSGEVRKINLTLTIDKAWPID